MGEEKDHTYWHKSMKTEEKFMSDVDDALEISRINDTFKKYSKGGKKKW